MRAWEVEKTQVRGRLVVWEEDILFPSWKKLDGEEVFYVKVTVDFGRVEHKSQSYWNVMAVLVAPEAVRCALAVIQ